MLLEVFTIQIYLAVLSAHDRCTLPLSCTVYTLLYPAHYYIIVESFTQFCFLSTGTHIRTVSPIFAEIDSMDSRALTRGGLVPFATSIGVTLNHGCVVVAKGKSLGRDLIDE
jgi:hypothetical protein